MNKTLEKIKKEFSYEKYCKKGIFKKFSKEEYDYLLKFYFLGLDKEKFSILKFACFMREVNIAG